MKRGQNFNSPKPGSKITVHPIKRLKDIKAIKKLLADKPRDLALFTVGINTNLRASDLLGIRVGDVRYLKPMDEFEDAELEEALALVPKVVQELMAGKDSA